MKFLITVKTLKFKMKIKTIAILLLMPFCLLNISCLHRNRKFLHMLFHFSIYIQFCLTYFPIFKKDILFKRYIVQYY